MTTMQDTVVVGLNDCFEHWHHVTCRQFSVTESERSAYRDFRARVSIRKFGPLMINSIWSSTKAADRIRVIRGPSEIRKDPRDYFMLWLARSGEVSFQQADRIARLRPGDLVLHDQSQPFVLDFGRTARAMMISIPRPLLLSRMPTAPNLTAFRVSGRSNLGALAGSFASHLVQLEGAVRDDVVRTLSVSAIDVFAAMLEAELTDHIERNPTLERLEEAKSYIMSNLPDNGMTLDAIAKAVSVSPRTLNRLFAREGTTPIRWLWQQRLLASHTALSDGHIRQVTEAALTFGFSDFSHFSRSFRAAFGKTPQDVMPRRRSSSRKPNVAPDAANGR
ncbi:helix-turn-helix domain-containing protein [Bradyrhizobium sp. KB893862 SZCCT0404]|uniref:helix-turn-helix domain-containing protein n=1 Tax=Bradyrhizobium sp. KB893862 SZCCT0404 TaxID=2807672 RepID=UPI001BAE4361|nr:helix-turn-helix domain-containing protein [Bradyrhizobium sp. KB893862 SZCCT0404]MBR1177182.1 helix-turn-helix domain-containing protein [Bradyrhizobium sp. KB893862 SZCCT0404]